MFNSSCPLNYAGIFSVHMLRRILLPSGLEKSSGFSQFIGFQIYFPMLRWCLQMGEYRTSIPWTLYSGINSHTVPLFSCPCVIWCAVPSQVFVQMQSALYLKLKNPWLAIACAAQGSGGTTKAACGWLMYGKGRGRKGDTCCLPTVLLA